MSSKDHPNDTGESDVIRERLKELREEFDALVRGNGVSTPYDGDGGFADLCHEVERLRYTMGTCGQIPKMAMPSRSYAAASADPPSPPFPPFPPYPPYPPVAPFPPYPPFPPNCGCCAPAPCGCPKCSGHVALPPPPAPAPTPVPRPVATISSSSPSGESSSSMRASGIPIGVRLPQSSSSSHYVDNLR